MIFGAKLHVVDPDGQGIGTGLGITFDKAPRRATVDHVKAGAALVALLRIVGVQNAAKGGGNADPRLLVYPLVELASECLSHLSRGLCQNSFHVPGSVP